MDQDNQAATPGAEQMYQLIFIGNLTRPDRHILVKAESAQAAVNKAKASMSLPWDYALYSVSKVEQHWLAFGETLLLTSPGDVK